MTGHKEIHILEKYFLNVLSPEEEADVQEHLSVCPECSAKLEAMRKLRTAFSESEQEEQQSVTFISILHSRWTRIAAVVVAVISLGVLTAITLQNRTEIFNKNGVRSSEGEQVFAVDTFDKEDSLYYREKYGDEFKF